jgi:hypothetical protein
MMEKTEASTLETTEEKREMDLEKTAPLFGLEKDKLKDENFSYDVAIPKDDKSKILTISRMIKVNLLKLQGYIEDPSANDEKKQVYKLERQPFASEKVLQSFESILSSYSDESNIITKKEWVAFESQAKADWRAFYILCMRDKAQPDIQLRAVYRAFQDCLINIGEITCDNPKNMENLFKSISNEEELNNVGNTYN